MKYDYSAYNGDFADHGNHGTTVAATCCADSMGDPKKGGIAPDAKVHVWDLSAHSKFHLEQICLL